MSTRTFWEQVALGTMPTAADIEAAGVRPADLSDALRDAKEIVALKREGANGAARTRAREATVEWDRRIQEQGTDSEPLLSPRDYAARHPRTRGLQGDRR